MLLHSRLLRADDLDHQLDRVRQPEGPGPRVRPGPRVGHDRLDRRVAGRSSSSWWTGRRCRRFGTSGSSTGSGRRWARRWRASQAIGREAVHLPGRRGRVARCWRRISLDAAAHAAEAGDRRGLRWPGSRRCSCCKHPFVVGAVPRHVHRRGRPPELLLLDRVVPRARRRRRRHPGELGPAGDEDRPDRRDPDDAHPRLRAEDASAGGRR